MKRSLGVCVLLLAISSTLHAQFTFANVSVPGAVSTEARGINNNGEVVGFYKTVTCQDSDIKVPQCAVKGFKLVNGSFVKLMVPGSFTTAINGVNDYGDLVGFYGVMNSDCSVPVYHGFVWFHQNVILTLDDPGSDFCGGPVTVPFGINKALTIVGGRWDHLSSTGTFPLNGWVWMNGMFSIMNPVAPNAVAPCCWSVDGVSNNGIIVGQVFQSDFNQAWLKMSSDEDFWMYFNPQQFTGGDSFALGVNNNTDVAGYGVNGGGYFAKHIELNEGTNDATEVSPGFIVVHFPNAGLTIPFAMNDFRFLAGAYFTASGTLQGFIARPNF